MSFFRENRAEFSGRTSASLTGLGTLLGCIALGGCGARPHAEAVRPAPAPEPAKAEAPPAPVIAELEVKNPSRFARKDASVYLSYYDLGVKDSDPGVKALAVVEQQTTVPSQAIDSDGNGSKDGLLVVLDLDPEATKRLSIIQDDQRATAAIPKRTQAEVSHKVGGAWQPRKDKPQLKEYVGGTFQNVDRMTAPPEHTDHSWFIRYEGPGIESDLVGYRVYLDRRNGFDIFGKRVATPVLQRVGQDGFDSYHELADWGMDVLKVGDSLGAGAFGAWTGKKIQLASEVDGWDVSILENGSLYSSFRIKYRGWKVEGKTIDLEADFSITAGSRAVQVRLHPSEPLKNLVVGVVKHPETQLMLGSAAKNANQAPIAYTYLASWGKQSLNKDHLGMAVLYRNEFFVEQPQDPTNYAAVLKPNGGDFKYSFLAAWEGEPSGLKTQQEFAGYLEQEVERMTIEPRLRLRTTLTQKAQSFPITAESALGWAKKLADSELGRKALLYKQGGWDTFRKRKASFDYDVVGLQPLAYHRLAGVTSDPRYADVIKTVTGSYVTETGDIQEYEPDEYNIDNVNPARNLVLLYEMTKEEKYKKAAAIVRKQLKLHPKTTEGAFWHKKKYPFQLWLDGVYMGMPFLASYAVTFDQGRGLDEVVREFEITRKRLRDPKTGLYFHAWDEKKKASWADPETGRSKFFWGRGMGWFSMAAVDVLDYIPVEDQTRRKPILEIIQELAAALASVQDPATGTWWQILDQPSAPGNYRESTASAMFTYFFAKATRKGYLPKTYAETAQKAFEGLVREFVIVHADGAISMTNQCLVAGLGYGRDGSIRYYMSEPVVANDAKGNGPFILAGVELYELLATAKQ